MALVVCCVGAVLGRTPAQQFDTDWIKRHLPAGDTNTYALAAGDVDGDDVIDVIAGDLGGQTRLYLGDGLGRFVDATAGRVPLASHWTEAVAAADLDGDGDLDLVLGNSSNEQNRLYVNDGRGTFADVTAQRLPIDADSTRAIAVADLDGDGDRDLVLGNRGQTRLYRNDGSGVFVDVTATALPAASYDTTGLAAGDVDSDGDVDLVLVTFGIGPAEPTLLYLNDGSGVFVDASSRLPSGADQSAAVALGDVDGDGSLDMVIGNYGQNRLFRNDGSGSFSEPFWFLPPDDEVSLAVAFADLDGDGDLDLAVGNSGTYPPRSMQTRIELNDGTGRFTDVSAARMPPDADSTRALLARDFDRDGDVDLAVGNAGGQDRLYLNAGRAVFVDGTASRFPARADRSVAAGLGDVDGDGDVDVVIGNDPEQNRLYLNDGDGRFSDATAALMPVEADPTLDLALADVDGDGDLDLVTANGTASLGRQNRLYRNEGKGAFVDVTAASLPVDADKTLAIAACDIDGDGDADLLFANGKPRSTLSAQNRLYLGDGHGGFVDATATHLPFDRDESAAVAVGDVDGDGDLDVVFGNDTAQNRLYRNDGSGRLTDVTASTLPVDAAPTWALAMGDVDGDGDLDLVLGNGNPPNALYLNDGGGRFVDATPGRLPASAGRTTALAMADIDLDGDLDLVLGVSLGPRNVLLYVNDGTGMFTDASVSRLPSLAVVDYTYAVATGDVDADGDADVLVVDWGLPTHLLINRHRQLAAPDLAILGRPYTLELRARPGYGGTPHAAIVALGPGLAPTPLTLPPYGALRLEPSRVVALPVVVIPPSTGAADVVLPIPAVPSLSGAAFFVQALIVDAANPADGHFTDVLAETLSR